MGVLHPQVVHFTIVLAIMGMAFRLVSLLGKPAFASPAATTLLLLAADSLLKDQKNPQAALAVLAAIHVPANNRFVAFQRANLQADAYEALGQKEAAAALEPLLKAFPNPRLQQRIDSLRKGSRPR